METWYSQGLNLWAAAYFSCRPVVFCGMYLEKQYSKDPNTIARKTYNRPAQTTSCFVLFFDTVKKDKAFFVVQQRLVSPGTAADEHPSGSACDIRAVTDTATKTNSVWHYFSWSILRLNGRMETPHIASKQSHENGECESSSAFFWLVYNPLRRRMPVHSPDNGKNPFQSIVYEVNHLSIPIAGLKLDRALTLQHLKYPTLLLGSIF